MTVQLPQHIYNEIIAHAREGKPEEICGILRGRGMVAAELFRGRNVARERIENYEVDQQTLLLQFKFEESGDEMMGVYHSHPISVAYPSATDAWNATYPDSIYLICSLEHDNAPVIRAFQMITHFLDVDVDALKATLSFYETRPHLFAYYQSAEAATPTVLQTIAQSVPTPFYIVYYEDGRDVEARIVSLHEHPLTVG